MNIAPSCVAQTRINSIWGEMLLVRTARGLAGVWLKDQAHHPAPFELPEEPRHPWFLATAAALAEWTARDPVSLPPLDPQGTAFQQSVWAQLRTIPRGASRSYGELAAQLGKPAASRAVGAAVGRNPISILVPCHRVIGKNGALTGYAGGLALKQRLLRAEGRLTETLAA